MCLAPYIGAADVEPLALGIVEWHKQMAPAGETAVVFRDGAFTNDVAKTNLTAILQQHGLENVRSLYAKAMKLHFETQLGLPAHCHRVSVRSLSRAGDLPH